MRRIAAVVSLSALIAGLLGAVAVSAVAPSVSVSPTSVVPGHSVLVTGRHWPRRVRVELLIGPPQSEASHVAWVTTTSSGTLRKRLAIARRAATGRFVLLACRRSCRVKVQASFRIVAGFAGAAAVRARTGSPAVRSLAWTGSSDRQKPTPRGPPMSSESISRT